MSGQTITGIHHVTAIAADPQRNLDFYTDVLGLRLVKLTVNFDDPGSYHFYFGNADGAPGSILTFFPWPNARRGSVGNGQVSATSFAVPAGSLDYWREHLARTGTLMRDSPPRFGETVLSLVDPDGLPLELVETEAIRGATPWTGGAIPANAAIAGFHSATLSAERGEGTAKLLQDVMGFRLIGREGHRSRYQAPGDQPASIVDVVSAPGLPMGRPGAGTVHHIAWRTPDDAQQLAWRRTLVELAHNVSPVMDRTYFHSIYFREPGGILFEIATDPPGFAIDEARDHLGERLMLPPQVEPYRARAELLLPPLTLPHVKHASSR